MSVRGTEIILSDQADDAIAMLKKAGGKDAKSVLKRVGFYREALIADVQVGEVVRFPLPKSAAALRSSHAPIENLYCLDLPAFWRLLYTIVRADGKPYVYVLEIVDHPTYSKWFPGRKKH